MVSDRYISFLVTLLTAYYVQEFGHHIRSTESDGFQWDDPTLEQ